MSDQNPEENGYRRQEQPFYRAIGTRIVLLRKIYHLTQKELSERVGMRRSALSLIEGGKQKLAVHELIPIAKALHVSLDDLLGGLEERL